MKRQLPPPTRVINYYVITLKLLLDYCCFFFLGFQGQGAGAVPTGAADAFMGRPEIDAQPRGVDGPMGEYGRSATTGKPGPLPSYQTFSSETSRMVYSERRSDPVDPLSLSENRSVMCHPGSWSEQSSSQQSVASVSRTSNMGQVMTNNVRKKYCNLIPRHRLNFPYNFFSSLLTILNLVWLLVVGYSTGTRDQMRVRPSKAMAISYSWVHGPGGSQWGKTILGCRLKVTTKTFPRREAPGK